MVAYGSWVLTKAERYYCTTRKELLAVVHFVHYFKHYLLGRRFLLRTDHGSLRWLFNFKDPEGQTARWLQRLGCYEFDIEHRAGRKHTNADAVSRIPCGQCGRSREADQECYTGLAPPVGAGLSRSQPPAEEDKSRVATLDSDGAGEDSALGGLPVAWDMDELAQEQQEDPELGPVCRWLVVGNSRPAWEDVAGVKSWWSRWDTLRLSRGVLQMKWVRANVGYPT